MQSAGRDCIMHILMVCRDIKISRTYINCSALCQLLAHFLQVLCPYAAPCAADKNAIAYKRVGNYINILPTVGLEICTYFCLPTKCLVRENFFGVSKLLVSLPSATFCRTEGMENKLPSRKCKLFFKLYIHKEEVYVFVGRLRFLSKSEQCEKFSKV